MIRKAISSSIFRQTPDVLEIYPGVHISSQISTLLLNSASSQTSSPVSELQCQGPVSIPTASATSSPLSSQVPSVQPLLAGLLFLPALSPKSSHLLSDSLQSVRGNSLPLRFLTTSTDPPASHSGSMSGRFRCYTKTGDKGTSSLFNGERRGKEDPVFQALGDVDELNSAVGVAHEYCWQQGLEELCEQLAVIQSRLLDVGSAVATPVSSSSEAKVKRVQFDHSSVDTIEKWLDEMDDQLPVLTNFILPSGGMAAVHLHLARSICRRAERAVVGLCSESQPSTTWTNGQKEDIASNGEFQAHLPFEPVIIRYMNRLSDYLFTAARFAALKAGREETIYKKGKA